jgi:phosphoenolpyruvate-protein kinase (PTS system EI component)
LFSSLLKPSELLLDMYRNAGQKSPEQFVEIGKPQIPPEVQAQMQQAQQMVQALQQELQKMQAALKDKAEEMRLKQSEAQNDARLEQQKAIWAHQEALKETASEFVLGMQKIQMEAKLELEKQRKDMQIELEQQRKDAQVERAKAIAEIGPRLLEEVGAVSPKVDGMQAQMMRLVEDLTNAVASIKSEVKGSRTKRLRPKLDANGDVIGGEIETTGGERYDLTLQ